MGYAGILIDLPGKGSVALRQDLICLQCMKQ